MGVDIYSLFAEEGLKTPNAGTHKKPEPHENAIWKVEPLIVILTAFIYDCLHDWFNEYQWFLPFASISVAMELKFKKRGYKSFTYDGELSLDILR